MANYITIDGGTTNTRISLVVDRTVKDMLKFGIGAKIDNQNLLKQTVKQGIKEILENNNMCETDITRILASGMITSEFGLVNLPHITAPAGISELHNAMHETVISDISSIPFVFVSGVKTAADSLENCDMMRGEETELMGILSGEGTYILSGSHSKIINVDNLGRITDFKTMLTGEMIAALRENTILKNAVNIKSDIDCEFLLEGFEFCKQNGINQSLFKVRILNNLFQKNASQVYSFYMGVVLYDEVKCVLSLEPKKVIIGGKKQIKKALAVLLEKLLSTKIEIITDEIVDCSATLGIVKIYEFT